TRVLRTTPAAAGGVPTPAGLGHSFWLSALRASSLLLLAAGTRVLRTTPAAAGGVLSPAGLGSTAGTRVLRTAAVSRPTAGRHGVAWPWPVGAVVALAVLGPALGSGS